MGILAWLRQYLQTDLPSRFGRASPIDYAMQRRSETSGIPEGWTDDMTIVLAPPRTLEELVDVVIAAEARHDDAALTVAHLIEEFGLSAADAELALDRTLGGLVRAASGLPDNRPSREKVLVFPWTNCAAE